MRILSLALERFRNHALTRLEIAGADSALFVGENGSGKTNVLEAVSVLAFGKSCRGADDDDVVQWNEGSYRVVARVRTDMGEERSIEVVSEVSPRRRKAGFLNDVRVPVSRVIGELPVVAFLPEDLDLFRGPPQLRRKLLDQLLCQVSPAYLQELTQYHRLLKQRNALLKRINAGEARMLDLDAWDTPLACSAARITVARLELMETFGVTLPHECAALGLPWTEIRFLYDRSGAERDVGMLEQEMVVRLRDVRDRDCIIQSTTVGPHRDDWSIAAGGRNVTTFASRGQERLLLLALLTLEVSYLQLQRGETPVVLLDDAFSELDAAHGALLLPALTNVQVLLTSAHDIPMPHGAGIWDIVAGTALERVPETATMVP